MARKFTTFSVRLGTQTLELPLRISDTGEEFSTTLFNREILGVSARAVKDEAQRRYTASVETVWDAFYIVKNGGLEAVELTRDEILLGTPPAHHSRSPAAPRKVRLYREAICTDQGMITPKFEAEPQVAEFKDDDPKLIPVNDETRRALVAMLATVAEARAVCDQFREHINGIAEEFTSRFGPHNPWNHGQKRKGPHPERPSGYGVTEPAAVIDRCVRVVNEINDTCVFPKILKQPAQP